MAINSKVKGKNAENELARKLRDLGFKDARRSQQYAGINNDADLVGVPGVHIEVKRVERLNLEAAMEQAIRDAKEDEAPMVFHRKNGKPWMVTMLLADWATRERIYQKEWDE